MAVLDRVGAGFAGRDEDVLDFFAPMSQLRSQLRSLARTGASWPDSAANTMSRGAGWW